MCNAIQILLVCFFLAFSSQNSTLNTKITGTHLTSALPPSSHWRGTRRRGLNKEKKMSTNFPLMQFSPGAANPNPNPNPPPGSSGFPSVDAFKQQQMRQQLQHHSPTESTTPNPFKTQLQQLNMELDGFSRRVGGESLISAPGTNGTGMGYRDKDDLKTQLGGLSSTMQQVNTHLEVDRLEKRQMQDEIDRMQVQLAAARQSSVEAAAAAPQAGQLQEQLNARGEEIATLREEKAVMKEWLDRGVNECRRVAEEVQRLRRELEDNSGERGRLGEEKQHLEQMLEKVMSEVRDTRTQLDHEKGEKQSAMDDMVNGARTIAESAGMLKQTQGEVERLTAEVSRLMERVRDTEESEMHLRTLVSGLRRTANGYLAFHTAVEQDRLGDLIGPATEAADSNDAAGSGPLANVVGNGKASLAELQDVLLSLRATVRVRLEDTQQRCAELAQKETANAQRAVDGAKLIEQDIRERHQIEKRMLEGKLQELEYELSGLSENNVSSMQKLNETEQEAQALRSRVSELEQAGPTKFVSPADHAERHMQELDRFAGNDEELVTKLITLQSRCAKLEASNAKLKDKSKKLKVEWGKVSDTRQHCQQLELEKRTMQGYIEKVEMENETLRRRMHGGGGGGGGGSGVRTHSPSKMHEAEQSSAAWREWQRTQSTFESWKANASGHSSPMKQGSSMHHPHAHAHHNASYANSSQMVTPHMANRGPSPSRSVPQSGPWMPMS